jgi:hypothetical protein
MTNLARFIAAALLVLAAAPGFAIPGANAQSPAQPPGGELLFSQSAPSPNGATKAAKTKKRAEPKGKTVGKSKKSDTKKVGTRKAAAKKKAATRPPS